MVQEELVAQVVPAAPAESAALVEMEVPVALVVSVVPEALAEPVEEAMMGELFTGMPGTAEMVAREALAVSVVMAATVVMPALVEMAEPVALVESEALVESVAQELLEGSLQ